MTLQNLSLDDKYAVERGRVFLTGIQALVRLPLMQRALDRKAGLNTAGFISGYRGSPLGGFDQQLARAKKFLDAAQVRVQPGINEDLGATAVWGSQQVTMWPSANVDGVFGMWYGKAPGVDRTGDVFKHANAAGSAKFGGVLAIAGDDHACKSSTLPSQSEYAFMDAEIPVLNPAGIQEVLDFGLYGWAMSRFSGCWVGLTALAETMDASATVDVAPDRVHIMRPMDFPMPRDGLNIRIPDTPQEQERRLREFKIPAALAFARANVLNRTPIDSPRAQLGLVASGKSYLDLRQAMLDLGIDNKAAADLGLRILKVGMTWPLEPAAVRRFADGLETVLVIEEKRDLLESQLRNLVYDLPDARRPRVIGKLDADGKPLLRATLDLTVGMIALALMRVLPQDRLTPRMLAHRALIERKWKEEAALQAVHERQPWYCSGCPHNTSTKVPEGAKALGGIGCHYMVTKMDRATDVFTQMGGEGVPWVGMAPFTTDKHIFANLGDGTYFHSGVLAIRQAVSAKVNITYKVLYNDAVAMTGGQHVDGELSVPQLAHQLAAEGVRRIVVMSDEPEKYTDLSLFPRGISVEHRDRLDAVQKQLMDEGGVTILLYDQTCAAEKRRRRKRGVMVDPPKRVIINELVCEGCGDCSTKSNCLSVEPVETEFGRKRKINQSSCNKDFSCTNGFCPSFVTLHDAKPAIRAAQKMTLDLPEPALPALGAEPWNVIITGIGGTGVTSVGAILGTAAHFEEKQASVLDMMGLAQKGGGVTSYVRIGGPNVRINGPRVPTAAADVLIACDMVVASKPDAIDIYRTERTHAVVNADLVPTAGFIKNNAIAYDVAAMKKRIAEHAKDLADCPAEALAERLLGDTIYANMLLVGFAWQKGFVPIARASIERAIELNGASVEKNKQAFAFGRLAAHDAAKALDMAGLGRPAPAPAQSLDEIVRRRTEFLTAYQNAAYAERYAGLVAKLRAVEAAKAPGRSGLAEAAARALFKLMAYKDEYEVARLYTDGAFKKQVEAEFGAMPKKISFHLSPPLLAPKDKDTGLPKKMTFGPWMMPAFAMLAKLKGLRGTPLDLFGYTHERRTERALVAQYEATLAAIAEGLAPGNHALAVELASCPMEIKGFGHVKERNLSVVRKRWDDLLARFRAAPAAASVSPALAAAE